MVQVSFELIAGVQTWEIEQPLWRDLLPPMHLLAFVFAAARCDTSHCTDDMFSLLLIHGCSVTSVLLQHCGAGGS